MTTETQNKITEEKLAKLGFTMAATQLKEKKLLAKKMMLAYEHYRYVTQANINAFNHKLWNERSASTYRTLDFYPIESYVSVPPSDVLEALEKAQSLMVSPNVPVFDSYEVASIREVKDPLLFGRVRDCSDRFFIAEWGSDVSIKDLLKENEG